MQVRSLHFSAQFDGDVSKLEQFNQGMDQAKEKGVKAVKALENTGKNMTKLGGDLTKKVTLPLVGVGVAGIKTVSDFDDGMSKVRAMTGATGDDFEQLREQAKQLGSETAFSAKQASEGMQILATSGKDVNEIGVMTPQILSMASASGMDLAESAGVVTQTMSQFGLTVDDTQRITDVYAKTASEADTNVSELAHGISLAGGNAKNMNMDLEQTNAMFALFAEGGLKGSRAGTAFNSMYRDLSSSAEDGNIKIGESSVAVFEANGEMKDMASIMADVEKATVDMTDEQRASALAMVFTDNSMQGVNRYLGQGTEKYKELEASIRDSKGASEEMADVMEDNLGGAFRSLKSAGEGFLIEVGDVLKDDVIVIADGVANLARKFGDLDEGTQKAIITGLGVVALIPPIIFGVGKLITIGTTLIGAFGKIAGVAKIVGVAIAGISAPVAITVGAIAGLVAGGIALWKNWDTVKEKASEVWGSITGFVSNSVESIKEKWEGLKTFLKNPIRGTIDLIENRRSKKAKKADGSHYSGLPRVPFDGYIAELHEDEEVLTADDPRNINNPKRLINNVPKTEFNEINEYDTKKEVAYERNQYVTEDYRGEKATAGGDLRGLAGGIDIKQDLKIIIEGNVTEENLEELTDKIKRATREELERMLLELKLKFGILGGETA